MIKPRRRLVDATVAALYIRTAYDTDISPATIRSWAHRGRIRNHGTGRTGAHFDLDEIDNHVQERLATGSVARTPGKCNTEGARTELCPESESPET